MMDSIKATVNAKLNVGVGMIVGLPHDNKDNLAECLPFLTRAAKEGVADVSVGFYMALPGTELFHCLYDAGTGGLRTVPAATFWRRIVR